MSAPRRRPRHGTRDRAAGPAESPARPSPGGGNPAPLHGAAPWLVRGLLLAATLFFWRGALQTHFGADDVLLLGQVSQHGPAGGAWRLFDRWTVWLEWLAYGPHPLLYHAKTLASHALNVQLVLWLALSMGAGLGPAALGAALFAMHPLSFGCVYPPSGLGTLAGLTALLAAALVWRAGPASARRQAVVAALGVVAVLFKETYAPGLLALAFLPPGPDRMPRGVADEAAPPRAGLAWQVPAFLTLLAGAGLLAAALSGPLQGSAYGLDLASVPRVTARYLDWLFAPQAQPAVPDFIADARGALHAPYLAAGLVFLAFVAWAALGGGAARGPAGAARPAAFSRSLGAFGLAWMLLLTAPALLTPRHLYLYYLYGSLAGFGLLVSAAAARLAAAAGPSRARWVSWGTGIASVACVVAGAAGVEARRSAELPAGPYPTDPFIRQQEMVRNFVADFQAAGIPAGARVVCYGATVQVGSLPFDSALAANNPIAAATDSGRVMRLFGLTHNPVRFASRFDPADTSSFGLLYLGNARLVPLGTGPGMLSHVAEFWASLQGWDRVEAALGERVRIAPGDSPSWFNLALARVKMGRATEARDAARQYLKLAPGGPQADWARRVTAGN